MTVFALVSLTKLVTAKDLWYLSKALEVNAYHCAAVWGRSKPAVAVVDSWDKLDLDAKRNVHPIVFMEGGETGTLAEHWWDVGHRGPSARVFVGSRSELRLGPHSLAESAAHEIVEAMIDPFVNLWSDCPGRPGIQMALEIADMTQDTYEVLVGTDTWQMANFVTPDYFESRLYPEPARTAFLAAGGAFDHARRMKFPGEILPTGYAILRRPKDHGGFVTYPVYGSGASLTPDQLASKLHPWARSALRGCVFNGVTVAAKKKMDSERPAAKAPKGKVAPKPVKATKSLKNGRLC